jgi:adenylosuccinate lyase
MEVSGGVIFSQAMLLKLIEKGLTREDAYRIVQSNAMKAWNVPNGNFKQNLLDDPEVKKHVSKEEIEACLQATPYLKNIDQVFQRLGI